MQIYAGLKDIEIECDSSYGLACFSAICRLYIGFDDGLSIGLGTIDQMDTDNGDNGTYVLGRDWNIIERYGSGSRALSVTSIDKTYVESVYSKIREKLMLLNEWEGEE